MRPALKMKTRATERGAVFCCEEPREKLLEETREKRKEEERKHREKREILLFFLCLFVCFWAKKVIFRCIPLKTSSLILTKPSHNKNNSLSLSLSLSPNDFSILSSSSQRVIIVL